MDPVSVDTMLCLLCGKAPSDPRLLSCLHAFCAECLRERAGREDICCPTCQEKTSVPVGGLEALPSDFLAVNLVALERLRQGQRVMFCDTCGGDDEADEATHRCVNCQIFLCEVHVLGHRKARKTASHLLQRAEEIRRESHIRTASDFDVVRRSMACTASGHEEKMPELFCVDCDKLVCRDCILVQHREHNYSFVRDAGEKQRQLVLGGLLVVRETSSRMDSVNKTVEAMQSTLATCVDELTEKIRQTAEMHKKRIEQREKALLDRVGELCRGKANMLEEQSGRLTGLRRSLDHCAGVASRVLEYGSDEEVIGVKAWLLRRMMSLTKAGEEEPQLPVDDGLLTFRFTQDCLCAIDEFGTVETRPFAGKSMLIVPPRVFFGQPIRSTVVLRNSLGEHCTSSGSTHAPWADLNVVVTDPTAIDPKDSRITSTSHCHAFEPETGKCAISTDLRIHQEGDVELSAILYQRHLTASPAIVRVFSPPWTIDSQSTLPDKSVTEHVVKVSDTKLSFTVAKPLDQQLERQWKRAQRSNIFIFGSKTLDGASPPDSCTWFIDFKETNEEPAKAYTNTRYTCGLLSVGVMSEACVRRYCQSSQAFHGRGVSIYDPNHLDGFYKVKIVQSVTPLGTDRHTASALKYDWGREDVDSLEAGIGNQDISANLNKRQLEWSSGHVLELQLTDITLTITNLSTHNKAVIPQVQLPCRPVVAVPVIGCEVTIDFP